ncbi:unnamed protein product [Bursaphelenchus okinawaensis]|uniref:Uncharacterized protein n=1 Tax=Bursaphelenchus okinawaensis TaxID=465554 RepID=A0A811K3K4_9BILA|nr:unnamed protein product [Bursaphelenchus okinawaensis]CAG9091009.1 unnamed protein product [Bursaphelenchus okinawaensis]
MGVDNVCSRFTEQDYAIFIDDIDNQLVQFSIEYPLMVQKSYCEEKRCSSLPIMLNFYGEGWEQLRASESKRFNYDATIYAEVKTDDVNFKPIHVELGKNTSIPVVGIHHNSSTSSKDTFTITVTVSVGSRCIGVFNTEKIYAVGKPPNKLPPADLAPWVRADAGMNYVLKLSKKNLAKSDYRGMSWYFNTDNGQPVASSCNWKSIRIQRQNADNIFENLKDGEIVRLVCEDYASPLLKMKTTSKREHNLIMQMDKVVFELVEDVDNGRKGQVLSFTESDVLYNDAYKFNFINQDLDNDFVCSLYAIDSVNYAFKLPRDGVIVENPPKEERLLPDAEVRRNVENERKLYGHGLDEVQQVFVGSTECAVKKISNSLISFTIPDQHTLISKKINFEFFANVDGRTVDFSLPVSVITKNGILFWTRFSIQTTVETSCLANIIFT